MFSSVSSYFYCSAFCSVFPLHLYPFASVLTLCLYLSLYVSLSLSLSVSLSLCFLFFSFFLLLALPILQSHSYFNLFRHSLIRLLLFYPFLSIVTYFSHVLVSPSRALSIFSVSLLVLL